MEITGGDAKHDGELRNAAAAIFSAEGRPTGSAKWTVRVTMKQIETRDELIGNQTVTQA